MRYPIPSLVLFSAFLGLGVPTLATAQPSPGFCTAAQHHVEADSKLSETVRQVFGNPRYSVQTRQDAACIYPLQVLRYGTADVLLTIGNEPGQACHGCSASLSAYFLARQGGGLKLVNKVVDFGQVGTSGDPGHISPIRIGHDDGIAIESGGTFQGHTSKALDFYAFHAGRVVHVEASPRVTLSASNAGAIADGKAVTDVTGSWSIPSSASDTLRVEYRVSVGDRRSMTSVTWRLAGPRWLLSSGEIPAALKTEME